MALKRIVLHGYLKDIWPHEILLDCESAAEAVNALCLQTKAFDPLPGQPRHQLRVVGFDDAQSLYLPTTVEEFHLVPDFSGGKGAGGFIKIAIGAVLIAVSIFAPWASAPLWAGMSTTWGGLMFSIGASLVLGGLMEMISPAPKLDQSTSAQDPAASQYLGAPKNTVKIGTRIPLIYGEVKAGGHYLSFDVSATDVDNNATTTPATPAPQTAPAALGATFVVGSTSASTELTWVNPRDTAYEAVEIYFRDGAQSTEFSKLGEVAVGTTTYTHILPLQSYLTDQLGYKLQARISSTLKSNYSNVVYVPEMPPAGGGSDGNPDPGDGSDGEGSE